MCIGEILLTARGAYTRMSTVSRSARVVKVVCASQKRCPSVSVYQLLDDRAMLHSEQTKQTDEASLRFVEAERTQVASQTGCWQLAQGAFRHAAPLVPLVGVELHGGVIKPLEQRADRLAFKRSGRCFETLQFLVSKF